MTDEFYPATTINGHDNRHVPAPNGVAFTQHHRYGASQLDGAQEDDGQISCFCGYNDDDGNTVACDNCNKWNHSLCYYPEYDGQDLPARLEHFCVECNPRPVDVTGANARQRYRRAQQELLANGAKRPPAKSHKKKIKEPVVAGHTNGWPLDKVRHDRNSASPRDLPPPAKRPKTSHHRVSESSANTSTKGHSRKRTVTNADPSRSVSQSPDASIPVYSPEFIRCHSHDQWRITQANLHNDIGVTNALSEWLRAPEDAFREMHGLEKTEVLMRWDGDLDDIPGKAQIELREEHDDRFQDASGHTVMWKTVTVQDPVANGAYLGELKGHVGVKEDYKADATNRWPFLRHPEPFVFFHPRLPLYVDARNEGTNMRFVRRSCTPNAELRVLVTDSTDYRFCFMATEQIDPGVEVAVAWDTAESMPAKTNGFTPSTKDMDSLGTWVSTVLSNCGPCACGRAASDCAMSRFDRRRASMTCEEETQSVKLPKTRKKKIGHHISPLDTHALNSRSGSEARKVEQDDEPTESRSISGSGDRDSASRDITPNTHYSANGSLSNMPELSARERKKLEREEEIFKRQEEEQSGKQSKKKRNSAGSALNTPSATSARQSGFPGTSSRAADAGTSKQPGMPSAKSINGKRPRALTTHKESAQSNVRSVRKAKPVYANAYTQCDRDEEDAAQRAATAPPRRKYISVTQRLLERCALNNARYNASQKLSISMKPVNSATAMDTIDAVAEPSHAPQSEEQSDDEYEPPEPIERNEFADDVDMQDAPHDEESLSPRHSNTPGIKELVGSQEHVHGNNSGLSQPPMELPAPSWASGASQKGADLLATQHSKHVEMHVPMPPPPMNSFAGPASAIPAGTSSNVTGSIAQSPAGLIASAPMFSPSVTAAVTPSSARKKLSLSDYTRRSKAKDKDHDTRNERDSSPASVASGPVVPTLHPTVSDAARVRESSSAVEDDVNMEDVAALPRTKA
ncbi:hypothetical protein LTR08_004904 [Meristemomyces frigidus]|nr:hypothetical protein LTR08_004904 [Meristemomyces frigidus]